MGVDEGSEEHHCTRGQYPPGPPFCGLYTGAAEGGWHSTSRPVVFRRSDMNAKFPRIGHLSYSPGINKDDIFGTVTLPSDRHFMLSEKMDGSNVALTRDEIFARTHAHPPSHPSYDALKALHAGIRFLIPEGHTVFCEWCWAIHSIEYDGLPNPPLFMLGVRREPDTWLSLKDREDLAKILKISKIPAIWAGSLKSEKDLEQMVEYFMKSPPIFGPVREGIVVSCTDEFKDSDWNDLTAKWVRAGHVQTDEHWLQGPVRKQKLAPVAQLDRVSVS